MNSWDIQQALSIINTIQEIAAKHGFDVALTGSVLYQGYSEKDLDIVLFNHKKNSGNIISFCDEIKTYVHGWNLRDHSSCGDDKIVYACFWNLFGFDKRIDFIFPQHTL